MDSTFVYFSLQLLYRSEIVIFGLKTIQRKDYYNPGLKYTVACEINLQNLSFDLLSGKKNEDVHFTNIQFSRNRSFVTLFHLKDLQMKPKIVKATKGCVLCTMIAHEWGPENAILFHHQSRSKRKSFRSINQIYFPENCQANGDVYFVDNVIHLFLYKHSLFAQVAFKQNRSLMKFLLIVSVNNWDNYFVCST